MLHDDDWIPTSLVVRTIAAGEVEAAGQARCCSAIFGRLESGEWGILGACTDPTMARGESPIAVVTIYQVDHGHLWAYVDLATRPAPTVMLAGVTPRWFDVPLPQTPCPHASISVMRTGLVRMRQTVWGIIDGLDVDGDGLTTARCTAGWHLDVDEVLYLAEQWLDSREELTRWTIGDAEAN